MFQCDWPRTKFFFPSSPSLRLNNSVFDAVSPHDNLQRNGESGVSERDDETKISEFVLRSVSSDLHLGEQHESSSSEPCPKRLRSDETLGGEFSPNKESRNAADQNLGSDSSPGDEMIERIGPSQVLCKERAMLLRNFAATFLVLAGIHSFWSI